MKMTKRILASVLSVILAFSCFAVVPVFAETLTVGNLTHLDTSSATSKTYADKLARTTLELDSKYTANIQLSNMIGSALKAKVAGDTNRISAISLQQPTSTNWTAFQGDSFNNLVDMNYYYHDDNAETVATGTQWGAGGSSYYEKACSTNSETIIYSAERIAANKYDFLVAAELSSRTAIEKFVFVGGPNQQTAPATYAIFVGDKLSTLYSAENQVFLFDAYNNYKDGGDWKFNGGGSGVARGTESQYLEFTGDTLPTGKYVGIKLYDACVNALTTYPAYLIDIFVSGETVAAPKSNLTHLDETSATIKTYAEKLERTTLELNEKYTANIQLSNMIGSALKSKVADDTNVITAVKMKQFKENVFTTCGETSFNSLIDMNYYNHDDNSETVATGTQWGTSNVLEANGYEKNYESVGDTEVLYGADRIAKDRYDVLVTAVLSRRTAIDKILYVGGPNQQVANCTYAIFVSDDEATLYSAENQVFLFDAYNNYKDGGDWKFNGGGSGVARGTESQYLQFTGDVVPVGKYVGFKIYDGATMNIGGAAPMYINDLFVSGAEVEERFEIATSSSEYKDVRSYSEKLSKLSVSLDSKYKATLQLADLTLDTLPKMFEGKTNQLESGEYQTWADRGTDNWNTAVDITALTDLGYVGYGTTTLFGSNTLLNTTGYNKDTYAAAGDAAEYKGTARVTNNRYDMLLTFELKGKTAIDKLYMVGHPNPGLAPFLYEVYVGDDKATLYTAENKVFYYDYSAAAASGEGWKFNGSSGSGNRTSDIQYLEFRGDVLPTGKYVGFKIYDAAEHSYYGACNICDIGVYGDITEYTASNFVSYSFGTTSELNVVNVGKSGGATILDAEGNETEIVKMGDTITFKAEPVTDSRHTFLGWYNGDTKVSGDLEYTTTFDGTALEAKYSTDLIFLMTPGENVVAKSAFTNCKPSFGLVDWLYDAEEDAMLIKGQKKTIQGDNPDTEEVEESYEAETLNSALVAAFTIDGKNIYNTQYEPWTTYKYSVTLKATGNNLSTTAAASGFNFQNQTDQTGYIRYDVSKQSDYVTYDFYFNSGAADYNGAATRSTKFISNNLFNFSGLPDGTNVYVKEMAIEKVNTIMVGNADNATVTPYGAFKPHITDQKSLIADADNTAYGGLTAANAIEALIYDSLAESKVIGSADNGKAMFTVQAAYGYDVTAVKVNGEAVTADENGVYTYLGAAVDDGIDHDFLADGTKTYVVDVETAVHVHQEVEIPAKDATCTEPGATAGVKCATCGEILEAPEAIAPLGHTEKTVPGYAATCEEAGLTDGIVCTVCGETVKAQEEIPALGHKMVLNAEKTQLVCANNCGKTVDVNVITFASKDNEVLHEVILEIGQNLTTDDIEAAEAKVPAIYGYEFAGWNDEVIEEVVASRTFTATYKKLEVTYTVTVNHINGTEVLENLPYDSKLTITDKYATQWLIGDAVIGVGNEIVVYVAGDMEITASDDEVSAEPSVAIVHDQAIAYEDSNTYVTFAHVNAADKEISEIGFIYITGTTYTITGEEGFNMANLDSIDRKYVKATLPRVGSDFMVSYEGITKAQGAQRYARAYVIFEGDDQVYYSNVVGKTFNKQ